MKYLDRIPAFAILNEAVSIAKKVGGEKILLSDGDVEKAISIYMNDEANSDTKIDYTDIPRRHWLHDTSIKTDYTEFVDKKDNVFSANDNLDIFIKWTNEKDDLNILDSFFLFKYVT